MCSRSFSPIYALNLTSFGVSTHFILHTKSKNLPAVYRGSTPLIQGTWSKIWGLHKPLHGLKVPFLSLGSLMAPYRVSGGRTKPTLFFLLIAKTVDAKTRTDKAQICSNGLREENRNPKSAMTKTVPCLSRCYPFAFLVTECRQSSVRDAAVQSGTAAPSPWPITTPRTPHSDGVSKSQRNWGSTPGMTASFWINVSFCSRFRFYSNLHVSLITCIQILQATATHYGENTRGAKSK